MNSLTHNDTPAMKTINVRRMSGERVPVRFADCTYYEVTTENATADEWTYTLTAADTATAARKAVAALIGDKAVSARKLSHGEVAVLILNGYEVVGA